MSFRRFEVFCVLWVLLLAGCSSGSGGSDVDSQVDVQPISRPQVLNGGLSGTFREGAEVILTGRASEGGDGPVIAWAWEQTSGPTVRLIEADSAGVSFTAPRVEAATTMSFELAVEDTFGVTARETVQLTVVPARDSDKFLSLDISSGLTFDGFRVVAALAGDSMTGAQEKPFTLHVASYLVYPPRTAPAADCAFDPADFAGGIPQTTASGCFVEPLAEPTTPPMPGGGFDISSVWPAGITAPTDPDTVSILERWWNPRFTVSIPRLDVREFNQRFVDARQRNRILESYLAQDARIVVDITLDAPENQSDAALILTDLTNLPLSLPVLAMGGAVDAEVIANPGTGEPTRLIFPLDALLAAINGREFALTAEVYYRTIDPMSTRTTLNAWLRQAGFSADDSGTLLPQAEAGTGEFAHAVYVNNFDLGFGRQMYSRTDEYGNVFSFVKNYSTLAAAIRDVDSFATVVMEYSPLNGHADPGEKFVKFFTYIDDGSGDERLVSSFDFDGRGERFTPGNCTTCHGGAKPPGLSELIFDTNCGDSNDAQCYAWPETNRDRDDIANGNLQAMFLPWDIDSLLFADTDPAILDAPVQLDGISLAEELRRDYGDLSRAVQLSQLKRLNQATYHTYVDIDADSEPDEQRADTARRQLEHWYGGVDPDGQLIGTYDDSTAIAGWLDGELLPDPEEDDALIANPTGSADLYLDMYARHCRMCHTNFLVPNLRFDTYRDFIVMEPLITRHVFGSGVMPGARLTMDRFWSPFAGGEPPGLLLSRHIEEVIEDVSAPAAPGTGSPVIKGLERTPSRGDTVYLSGSASLLADTYLWELGAPGGSTAALVGTGSAQAQFVVDEPGDYTVSLTVNAGQSSQGNSTVIVSVPNAAPVPANDLFQLNVADGVLAGSVFAGPVTDDDPEGDSFDVSVDAGSMPADGSVTVGSDGAFTYTYTGDLVSPPASDRFGYVMTDAYGASATGSVTILLSAADPALRPTTPVLASATDASTAAADASVFQTSLVWAASSDDVGVIGYNIYRDGDLLEFLPDIQPPGTEITYMDSAVAPDTRYIYFVTAVDADGESTMSEGGVVKIVPSLRRNIQTGWGEAGDKTLWEVSKCVGCHRGAPGGLTLRGPAADDVFAELTEDIDTASPRVNPDAVIESQVLCKALLSTHPRSCVHGGGDFLAISDQEFLMLSRWIGGGAPDN